jgi:hypothetical protein
VCGKCFPDPPKTPKTFFRQKKLSQKVFGGKNVTDFFFQNYNYKKNFKILENYFWIFIF